MEPSTQTTQSSPSNPVPTVETSHKKLYIALGAVLFVVVVAAFVGLYMWQQSTYTNKINEVVSQKAVLEQEVASLKGELEKEKLHSEALTKEVLALTSASSSEKELLEMFKKMITYKFNLSATSTVEMTLIQKTASSDAYKIGVGINCKEGATEEENKGCAGIEKFYKRKNGTWMIVGFNDGCPLGAESEELCAKAGF